MAVTCTPAALSAAAECYRCALTPEQQQAAQVYLLAQLTVTLGALTAAQVTPAALSRGAECYKCALTPKQLEAAMVYLLCQLTAS